MFDLNDKRAKRRRIIFGYAQMDAQHGVLLAAMDFEWTCRRAILALSKNPTVVIYEKFIGDYSAFTGLTKAWQEEVMPNIEGAITLQDLVSRKIQWNLVRAAMQCRNMIIHGTESRVADQECRWAVCVLEDACDVVAYFAKKQDSKGIFKMISRRRTKKEIAGETADGKKLKSWRDLVDKEIAKYSEDHWIKTGQV